MSHERVLIVDHDRHLRSQLYTRLLDVDVFSDCVGSVSEALEHLRDRRYTLILVELELPGDEAYALIDQVRVLPATERPMVLATAARDTKRSVDADLVQIVIRKPLRLGDVSEMIRSCVGSAKNAMARLAERHDSSLEIGGGDQNEIGVVR